MGTAEDVGEATAGGAAGRGASGGVTERVLVGAGDGTGCGADFVPQADANTNAAPSQAAQQTRTSEFHSLAVEGSLMAVSSRDNDQVEDTIAEDLSPVSLFTPRRRFGELPEMIDAPDADPDLLRGELRNLRRINRRIGSLKLVSGAVTLLAAGIESDRAIAVVDLATGSADHPVALVEAFQRIGRRVSVTAIDRNPAMLAEARRVAGQVPEIRVEQGDVLALPYPDRHFDIATCSFALHHLSRAQGIALLREMDRLTRVGFVVHDLARSYVGAAAAWIYTHLMTTNVMTRRDGYLSVLNAFTAEELRDMATEAGIGGVRTWNAARLRLMAVKRH